jgi:hypothetical protein
MLGAILGGAITVLVLGTLLGAFILQYACHFYNRMAGVQKTPASIPEPSFARACAITLMAILVNMAAASAVGLLAGRPAAAAASVGSQLNTTFLLEIYTAAMWFPVGLVITTRLLSDMLPTTFLRALPVTLMYMALAIAIVAGLAGIAIVIEPRFAFKAG